jgi:hypothetical protein
MSQTSSAPSSPPKARLLAWFVNIALVYFFLTGIALVLHLSIVTGAALAKRPLTPHIGALQLREAAQMSVVPNATPARIVMNLTIAQWQRLSRFVPNTPMAQDAYRVSQMVLARGAMAFGLLIPLMTVLAAAIADGLARRELRKYGGDPESSLIYHTAKDSTGTWLGLVVFAYLLIPYPINPHWVLLALAPGCAFTVALTIARFKKYL